MYSFSDEGASLLVLLELQKLTEVKKIIMNIQVPKKYVLVKINKNGEKIPLNEEEINEFMEKNTEINVNIENYGCNGEGVAKINGEVVFLPYRASFSIE